MLLRKFAIFSFLIGPALLATAALVGWGKAVCASEEVIRKESGPNIGCGVCAVNLSGNRDVATRKTLRS